MEMIANYYHAHPILWTLFAIWFGYTVAAYESDKKLRKWQEWHARLMDN